MQAHQHTIQLLPCLPMVLLLVVLRVPHSSPSSRTPNDPKKRKETGRKEDVNFTQAGIASHFSYMVTMYNFSCTKMPQQMKCSGPPLPQGYAIVDTGCTTSVIGQESAKNLIEHFKKHGFPPPDEVTLPQPAVELKGFDGKTETTTMGLK